MITSLHEETTSYDEDKDKLLSCLKDTVELLYKLVDQARKLDHVLSFLTTIYCDPLHRQRARYLLLFKLSSKFV